MSTNKRLPPARRTTRERWTNFAICSKALESVLASDMELVLVLVRELVLAELGLVLVLVLELDSAAALELVFSVGLRPLIARPDFASSQAIRLPLRRRKPWALDPAPPLNLLSTFW